MRSGPARLTRGHTHARNRERPSHPVGEGPWQGPPIEDYDLPDLKTENGVADVGFAWMAWIIDPGKNALAIVQPKP